jgi:hypothetical protein
MVRPLLAQQDRLGDSRPMATRARPKGGRHGEQVQQLRPKGRTPSSRIAQATGFGVSMEPARLGRRVKRPSGLTKRRRRRRG